MTPFDRALSIVTEYEAAGETSAARMLLLTRIEDLCQVEDGTRAFIAAVEPLLQELADRTRALVAAARCARHAAEAERVRLLQDFCITGEDGCPVIDTMTEGEAAIVEEWAQVVAGLDAALVGGSDAPA